MLARRTAFIFYSSGGQRHGRQPGPLAVPKDGDVPLAPGARSRGLRSLSTGPLGALGTLCPRLVLAQGGAGRAPCPWGHGDTGLGTAGCRGHPDLPRARRAGSSTCRNHRGHRHGEGTGAWLLPWGQPRGGDGAGDRNPGTSTPPVCPSHRCRPLSNMQLPQPGDSLLATNIVRVVFGGGGASPLPASGLCLSPGPQPRLPRRFGCEGSDTWWGGGC